MLTDIVKQPCFEPWPELQHKAGTWRTLLQWGRSELSRMMLFPALPPQTLLTLKCLTCSDIYGVSPAPQILTLAVSLLPPPGILTFPLPARHAHPFAQALAAPCKLQRCAGSLCLRSHTHFTSLSPAPKPAVVPNRSSVTQPLCMACRLVQTGKPFRQSGSNRPCGRCKSPR